MQRREANTTIELTGGLELVPAHSLDGSMCELAENIVRDLRPTAMVAYPIIGALEVTAGNAEIRSTAQRRDERFHSSAPFIHFSRRRASLGLRSQTVTFTPTWVRAN